jgi:two-component system sensor histidine kinase UhpB
LSQRTGSAEQVGRIAAKPPWARRAAAFFLIRAPLNVDSLLLPRLFRWHRTRRCGWAVLAWIALSWGLLGWPTAASAQSVTVSEAMTARADTPHYPTASPQAAVKLPHRWDRDPRESRPLWYRLRFQLLKPPAEAHQLAAYFEHVCSAFELQVNGQVLTTPFDDDEVRSRACHDPVLVPLPAALLLPGDNVLDVKLRGAPLQRVALTGRAAALSPVLIGRHDQLQDEAQQARLLNHDLTIALTALAAACGLAALAMARISRLDYLAYFGAAALGWALWLTLMHVPALPLPALWSEALLICLLPPLAAAAMLFLLR